LDLWFKSYEVLKKSGDLWASCQPLPMQQNLPKTAKNCQNLPKDKTLKCHQKLGFKIFLKIKICMCRGGTRTCFHRLDFQSKNFSYAIFIVKKRPLYVNFSLPLCAK
jgi:hypothetical protein